MKVKSFNNIKEQQVRLDKIKKKHNYITTTTNANKNTDLNHDINVSNHDYITPPTLLLSLSNKKKKINKKTLVLNNNNKKDSPYHQSVIVEHDYHDHANDPPIVNSDHHHHIHYQLR